MKQRTIVFIIVLPLLYLFGLSPLGAVEVYLNEVQITGAKDQLIENAKIYLDKKGDVHISAPEYKVREINTTDDSRSPAPDAPSALSSSPASATPVKSAPLHKSYFIVTDVSRLAMTGYSIKVIVNSKYITTLRDDIKQNILELNHYLHQGDNSVSFFASRTNGKSAQNALESDFFSLVLGEGHGEEGGDLTIDKVLCELKVRAADINEKSQNCTIRAQ